MGPTTPPDPRRIGEHELILGVRAGGAAAVREYVRRYRALLMREARLTGVPYAERESLVLDVLHDSAIDFIEGTRALPRSPATYLITAFRRRLYNQRRDRARRDGREERASEADDAPDGAVLALCSEAGVRASRGADDEPAVAPSVLRLIERVRAELTEEERLMLAWDAARVPYREIAEWLGIEYKAACKRMERLRARLRASALAHAAALSAEARAEARTEARTDAALDRILRRAGVWLDPPPTASSGRSSTRVEGRTT